MQLICFNGSTFAQLVLIIIWSNNGLARLAAFVLPDELGMSQNILKARKIHHKQYKGHTTVWKAKNPNKKYEKKWNEIASLNTIKEPFNSFNSGLKHINSELIGGSYRILPETCLRPPKRTHQQHQLANTERLQNNLLSLSLLCDFFDFFGNVF